MKKIMTFGTFDIFHKGHKSFLKQAGKFGDYLIVVVARDKTVKRYKIQDTRNKEQKRVKILNNSGLVDKVVLGGLGDKYAVIKKYKPDVICLGYDQKFFVEKIQYKLEEYKLTDTKIIRLKPYKPNVYKSSLLKKEEKN
jgi:cytidyltransferase-like protein